MSIVHLHLLLSHVPVVGTLVALLLFAAAILLRESVTIRFALGFSAAIAVVAVAVYSAREFWVPQPAEGSALTPRFSPGQRPPEGLAQPHLIHRETR